MQRFFLILLLFVVFAVASTRLNETMWSDENRSLIYAGAAPHYGLTTLPESIERIAENLWQAPAYYLTLWGWGRLVGWSVFALRILSVLFGILTIAITYRLGRYFFTSEVALYGAFVLGFGAFFSNFMHDMRTYTLMPLIIALILWVYVHITHAKRPHRILYPAFAICIALALYTHYFNVFLIAALGIYHLLAQMRRPHYVPLLIMFFIGGAMFLPWTGVLLNGAQLASDVPRQVLNLSAMAIIYNILYFFSNGLIGLAVVLVLSAFFHRPQQVRFIAILTLLSLGLLWGVTRIIPALTDIKYMLFIWVPVALLIGAGIHNLSEKGIPAGWFLGIWAVFFCYSLFSDAEQEKIHPWYIAPYQTLVDELRPYLADDDVVLFVGPPQNDFVEDPILRYYFYDETIQSAHVIQDRNLTSEALLAQQATDAIQDAHRVWLTYDKLNANWRKSFVEDAIEGRTFVECGTVIDTEHVSASIYILPESLDERFAFYLPDENISERIRLHPISDPYITDENTVNLIMAWDADSTFANGDYSVGLHIEDAQGQLIAQADVGVTANSQCMTMVIEGTAITEGDYILRTTVYNWRTGDRLTSEVATADQRPQISTLVIE